MPPLDDLSRRITGASHGDDDRVWPEVPRRVRTAAHRAIYEATRAVLAGGTPVPTLDDDAGLDALGIAAYRSGLGPLLGVWLASGQLRASREVAGLMADHLLHGRRRAQRLAGVRARILDAARARDVIPVLLKGAHTQRYFPEPGARPSSDIDILVPPRDLPAMREALGRAGLVETRHTSVPPRSEWGPPDPQALRTLSLDHEDNPWSVDLHTSLARTYARGFTAGAPDPFARTALDDVDGAHVRILEQPLLTVYLAQHAGHPLHGLRVLHLVELVLVIRHDVASGRLEWLRFGAYLRRTGLARFVYPALALTENLVPGTVPPRVMQALAASASRRMRAVTATVSAAGGRLPRRSLADKFMWARSGAEHMRIFLDLIRRDPDASAGQGIRATFGRRLGLLARSARPGAETQERQ